MATSILANMGVPSFMITPKDEYGLTEEEGENQSLKHSKEEQVDRIVVSFIGHYQVA